MQELIPQQMGSEAHIEASSMPNRMRYFVLMGSQLVLFKGVLLIEKAYPSSPTYHRAGYQFYNGWLRRQYVENRI